MTVADGGVGRPIPLPDPLTAPYWAAANEGRLEIQRCRDCGRYYQPPVSLCFACHSQELAYEPVSGRGTIYTYSVTSDARSPAFTARVPYAVVWVRLPEQDDLTLLVNMPNTPIEDVRIGAQVEVWFEEIEPGVRIPQFRLSD